MDTNAYLLWLQDNTLCVLNHCMQNKVFPNSVALCILHHTAAFRVALTTGRFQVPVTPWLSCPVELHVFKCNYIHSVSWQSFANLQTNNCVQILFMCNTLYLAQQNPAGKSWWFQTSLNHCQNYFRNVFSYLILFCLVLFFCSSAIKAIVEIKKHTLYNIGEYDNTIIMMLERNAWVLWWYYYITTVNTGTTT